MTGKTPETERSEEEARRDAILKRMLETPPKPHKQAKGEKLGPRKPSAPAAE